MAQTHEVFNQPEPLVGRNLFSGHQALRDALAFNAPGLDTRELVHLGERAGSAEMQSHARLANVHTPRLLTHDRFGRRIDQVEFHPSYHALMSLAVGSGLHGAPWAEAAATTATSLAHSHAHVRRAAGFMVFTELEPSALCPISMTHAATPALRGNSALADEWGPRLSSSRSSPARCLNE